MSDESGKNQQRAIREGQGPGNPGLSDSRVPTGQCRRTDPKVGPENPADSSRVVGADSARGGFKRLNDQFTAAVLYFRQRFGSAPDFVLVSRNLLEAAENDPDIQPFLRAVEFSDGPHLHGYRLVLIQAEPDLVIPVKRGLFDSDYDFPGVHSATV